MGNVRRHSLALVLGLAIALLLLGHAGSYYRLPGLDAVERILYDARLRLTAEGNRDPRIIILDIDEKSLATAGLGRWPWSRATLAQLVDQLFDRYQIALLGFDVVFAEPEQQQTVNELRQLANRNSTEARTINDFLDRIAPKLDHDNAFVRSISGRPVVLGYYFNDQLDARNGGSLPAPVLRDIAGSLALEKLPQWRGYSGNLGQLGSAAATAGHFNLQVDPDGVARKAPLLIRYEQNLYESLSLSMLRQWLRINGASAAELTDPTRLPALQPSCESGASDTPEQQRLSCLQVGPLQIALDASAAAWIPYRQVSGNYLHLSIADVWSGALPVESLRNKIVLVGTSAPGLRDLRSTPIAATFPGVEIHASLLSGMLDSTVKEAVDDEFGGEALSVLLCGLFLALTLPFLSLIPTLMLGTSVFGAALFLNYFAWQSWNMVLPCAATLSVIVALVLLNVVTGYLQTLRSRRQFVELFGQYVPPELVTKMAKDPARYDMQVRETELTILFSDVCGFTGISEVLGPRDLGTYINEYLSAMSHVIRIDFHGTLDKFIGDALMAFWGAPVSDVHHAAHAVQAAMAMQQALGALNRSFAARAWPPLKIGVGICTGVVRVGDMGSVERRAYTAMGNTVNTASRLEARTRHYAVGILVSEDTVNQTPEIAYREVDLVQLKGQSRLVRIYEPVSRVDTLDTQKASELAQWRNFLGRYRRQEWAEAQALLESLRKVAPEDGLYAYYQERLTVLRTQDLAPDWDAVQVFNEK